MTQLLDKALAEINRLASTEQDWIAALILDELADEHRWDAKFARSQDQLTQLARKVRADIQAGRTTPGGFDTQYLEQG